MKNLIVIQHCQSEHHINGLTGGWTDTSLTKLGIEQANRVGNALKDMLEGDYVLYSSDLLRAKETADIVSEILGIGISLEPGLRERNYGIAKDRTSKWLKERISPLPKVGRIDHRPIEGAETYREFYIRVEDAMERISDSGSENVIVVSHGGAKNHIIVWWLGLPVEALEIASFGGCPGAITIMNMFKDFHNLDILGYKRHLEG